MRRVGLFFLTLLLGCQSKETTTVKEPQHDYYQEYKIQQCCINSFYLSYGVRACSPHEFSIRHREMLVHQFNKAVEVFPDYLESIGKEKKKVFPKSDLLICVGTYEETGIENRHHYAETDMYGKQMNITYRGFDEHDARFTVAHEVEHYLMDRYLEPFPSTLWSLHYENQKENEKLALDFEDFFSKRYKEK